MFTLITKYQYKRYLRIIAYPFFVLVSHGFCYGLRNEILFKWLHKAAVEQDGIVGTKTTDQFCREEEVVCFMQCYQVSNARLFTRSLSWVKD